MRRISILLIVCSLWMPGCEEKSPTMAAPPDPPAQRAPAGDPRDLPKIAPDRNTIITMLRERFGEAVARNIRVEVEDRDGALRVGLRGEVPNEEIRQAVMNEVETRVEGVKNHDFNLEVAGPVPMLFGFDARVGDSNAAVFSPDIALAVSDKGDVYETATGRRINRIALPQHPQLMSMAISPDGKLLATGHRSGALFLWELPLGRNPRTLQAASDESLSNSIMAVLFSPDSRQLVSVNSNLGEVVVWNLADGSARTIGSHKPRTSSRNMTETHHLAISPDGKTIASANFDEDTVILWDIASRSQKQKLEAVRIHPEAIAWSHDGRTLAIGRAVIDSRGVVLWDLSSNKTTLLSLEQDALMAGMAFSPDDRTLAVSYKDSGVVLWDVHGRKIWMSLESTKAGNGRGIAFSPDGAVLATQCTSITPAGIRLWDVAKRPGGATAAALPRNFADQITQDDRLITEIEAQIRRNFDARNIESLKLEMQSDGAIKLSGRVSNAEVKRVAGRSAEVYHTADDIGIRELNKVVNELEVTGVYRQP